MYWQHFSWSFEHMYAVLLRLGLQFLKPPICLNMWEEDVAVGLVVAGSQVQDAQEAQDRQREL
jgi:hypothetical protein